MQRNVEGSSECKISANDGNRGRKVDLLFVVHCFEVALGSKSGGYKSDSITF